MSLFKKIRQRLRYRRIIERMHLAVCNPCHYDCLSCSHEALRYRYPKYQLSIDRVREFVHFTESSKYLIRKLHITGPGEPLLWRYLNEGIKILSHSPAIEKIHIITNGLSLDRIDEETWNNIDKVSISIYPSFDKWDQLHAAQTMHKERVRVRKTNVFRTAPPKGKSAPIPCDCDCTGPMYFDGKVFFYCGPPVFGAAESKGVDLYDHTEMYTEIGLDYLARSKAPRRGIERLPLLGCRVATLDTEKKQGNYELCKYCFANLNLELPDHTHVAFQSKSDRGSKSSRGGR